MTDTIDIPNETGELNRRIIIQFIDHETGQRSEAYEGDADFVKKILDARQEGQKPVGDDYILLHSVMDTVDGKQNAYVPTAPLIKVSTFIEAYNEGLKFEEGDNENG